MACGRLQSEQRPVGGKIYQNVSQEGKYCISEADKMRMDRVHNCR